MLIQLHFSLTGLLINKKCRWSNLNKATTFIFIFSYYMIISPCHHIDDNWLPITDITFFGQMKLVPPNTYFFLVLNQFYSCLYTLRKQISEQRFSILSFCQLKIRI